MARDRDDEFLMTALEESQQRVAALDISGGTRPWVETANDLLLSASLAFKELVEREDLGGDGRHPATGQGGVEGGGVLADGADIVHVSRSGIGCCVRPLMADFSPMQNRVRTGAACPHPPPGCASRPDRGESGWFRAA